MKQKIIEEYLNGKSISQLSREYPMIYRDIRNLLVKNNIAIRGGRHKKILTEDQIKIIDEEFYNGTPKKNIAKKIGYSTELLTEYLKEHNYKRNNNRINVRIDSNYFSIIDKPEKAYWLGMLFTDGCVDHYGATGRIRLQLQAKDKHILEEFKEDLKLDCKIIEDKRVNSTCLSVEFTDEQIYNDLAKYNIIPRKTYECDNIQFEKIPQQFLNSYLLGLFDGDGNFYCSKDYSKDVVFGFTSYTENATRQFQEQIDKLINKENHTQVYFTSAWHVR